ncbi:FMN-binding negative transcriptional regulator, partial [Bowmanella sp. Y57]|nr:FMN-binding negative transcriptional regulator [Bowmanella yangjiangensis]
MLMYCPSAFCQDDLATLHQQIQASGLALLSSAGEQGLQASHLPLLLEPHEGEFGT